MEKIGKFGKHSDLGTAIGLDNLSTEYWNLTPAELIEDSIILGEGVLTDTGALAIETGTFTGRSPKDRFIVKDSITENAVWWGDINIGFSPEQFDALYSKMKAYLGDADLYVRDAYACADEEFKMNIRVITEQPWSRSTAASGFRSSGRCWQSPRAARSRTRFASTTVSPQRPRPAASPTTAMGP